MGKKVLVSWSSGKDCAWALYKLLQNENYSVEGLFCTVNKEFNRVAMHGVRVELLKKQSESLDLPLEIIEIPFPCSNAEYEQIMGEFVKRSKIKEIEHFAFGDLFLEDVRNYGIDKLKGSGIEAIFPIWGVPTKQLAKEMTENNLESVITCIDPLKISSELIGSEFNENFLKNLPKNIDPCGENGEFHSFVFDGPMFKNKIEIYYKGEIVNRDNFLFIDLLLK